MPEPRIYLRESQRCTWKTDEPAAMRSARASTALSVICIFLGIIPFLVYLKAWPASVVLAIFAAAGLRSAASMRHNRFLIVIDGQLGTILCRHWRQGAEASAREQEWPIQQYQAVAIAYRCEVVVSRTVPAGRVQVDDLLVRLSGTNGGMTLAHFPRDNRDAAQQMANDIASITQLPLIRESIRHDGCLFQHAPFQTSMGDAANPDLETYIRELGADEPDNSRDREHDRQTWRKLEQPADALAPPNTNFFL